MSGTLALKWYSRWRIRVLTARIDQCMSAAADVEEETPPDCPPPRGSNLREALRLMKWRDQHLARLKTDWSVFDVFTPNWYRRLRIRTLEAGIAACRRDKASAIIEDDETSDERFRAAESRKQIFQKQLEYHRRKLNRFLPGSGSSGSMFPAA